MGEVVGSVTCPMCHSTAEAKQESRGSKCLYISCEGCGVLQPRRFNGQVWMRKHVKLFDEPEPEEQPEPEKTETTKPDNGGFFGWLADD